MNDKNTTKTVLSSYPLPPPPALTPAPIQTTTTISAIMPNEMGALTLDEQEMLWQYEEVSRLRGVNESERMKQFDPIRLTEKVPASTIVCMSASTSGMLYNALCFKLGNRSPTVCHIHVVYAIAISLN